MASTSITFSDVNFPDDFSGSLQDLIDTFIANLRGTVTVGFILGQIGGTQPSTNIGIWIDGDVIKIWNGSTYQPATLKIGSFGSSITFTSAPSGDKTQTFQDTDGIVALLDDIYTPRATLVKTGAAPVFNWGSGFSFYISTAVDVLGTITGSLPGQTAKIVVTNSSGSGKTFDVTGVIWEGGTAPTVAANSTVMVELHNSGGGIYGRVVGIGYA